MILPSTLFFRRIFSSLLENKFLLFLLALFFATRLINLTKLPLFNDEAIYLHWGWAQVIGLTDFYNSLYDGKQPLLIWIFGYAQMLIDDPLLAGRFISILTGFFTFIGVYLLGKRFFDKQVGLLAALLYVILPVFVFYDRQALMESSMGMVNVWACYLLLRIIQRPHLFSAILLGVILGVGMFIKSTAFIFFVAVLVIGLYVLFKSNNSKFKNLFLLFFVIAVLISQQILKPLYSQIDFYKIIHLNTRYSYTVSEAFQNFPSYLDKNISITFELLFFYLTPFIFVFSILGILLLLKRRNTYGMYLLLWFFLVTMAFVVFVRIPSVRYIVAFLPIITIFCAYAVRYLWDLWKDDLVQVWFLYIVYAIPTIGTLLLIFAPLNYFYFLERFTHVGNLEYIYGWTSGYGVKEASDFLLQEAKGKNIMIYVRSDSGNPEDGMFVYLGDGRYSNIRVRFTTTDRICLYNGQYPAYFVSRDTHVNNSCMQELKRFYKPNMGNFVGVYRIVK